MALGTISVGAEVHRVHNSTLVRKCNILFKLRGQVFIKKKNIALFTRVLLLKKIVKPKVEAMAHKFGNKTQFNKKFG